VCGYLRPSRPAPSCCPIVTQLTPLDLLLQVQHLTCQSCAGTLPEASTSSPKLLSSQSPICVHCCLPRVFRQYQPADVCTRVSHTSKFAPYCCHFPRSEGVTTPVQGSNWCRAACRLKMHAISNSCDHGSDPNSAKSDEAGLPY
jgi:hypothetical protein